MNLKFTEVFPLNGEAQKAATQLMNRLQLKETQRVIIGSDPKNLFVCITWEGKSDVWHLFKDDYIVAGYGNYPIYYHRLFLTGINCNSLSSFVKLVQEKEEGGGDFKIESLKNS